MVELAGELHNRARGNSAQFKEPAQRYCAHCAIPAKYVYRRRSAPYPLVLAWLIAACRLGKAWSLHMSYSCLALRLSRPSRYRARRLPENLRLCRPVS